MEAADRTDVRVERARCMAGNNGIKRIKRREKYNNPGEIGGLKWEKEKRWRKLGER